MGLYLVAHPLDQWRLMMSDLKEVLRAIREERYATAEVMLTKILDSEWVGLTKEEFEQAVDGLEDLEDCWVQIEAKLREKNT
jgi:hypothetical protein